MRVLQLAPLLFASALTACGTGLYDAAGIPASGAAGLTCDIGQIDCGGVCTVESRSQCGAACQDCTAAGAPPTNASWACLPGGACGYECDGGYLKCDSGCCSATSLAAGPSSTCARLDDGSVRCWGANDSGQLGDGTLTDRPAPAEVALTSAATAVAAGSGHACAIVDGAVVCWGANESGQVNGITTSGPVLTPASTPVLPGDGATTVATSAAHTCAIVSGGAVRCWGRNDANQLGGAVSGGVAVPIPSGATDLSAGTNHTCALVAGAVKCWGDGQSGQLGGTPTAGIATPLASGITLVAASAGQACASTGSSPGGSIDPVVKCWGDSLGATFLLAPLQVTPAIPMKDASQSTIRFSIDRLAAGRAHVCVGKAGEFVSCFGENARGQLGAAFGPLGPSEALTVTGNLAATALAAGGDHTCAIAAGRVSCWGANGRGQLGNGATADPGVGVVVVPSGR